MTALEQAEADATRVLKYILLTNSAPKILLLFKQNCFCCC